MNYYSENIAPDSFSGAIFAIEGIKDACTVLNGPTGCKFYHSAISDNQFFRTPTYDPLEHTEGFYFGQSRVPSTYLDGNDYVFGSGTKIADLLKSAVKKNFALIAVINSPGAALIGDDLERFLEMEVRDTPCFSVENTGFSGSFASGYQNALIGALKVLGLEASGKPKKKAVNLLGLCIYQKYYDQNYLVLKRLLDLCGIEVIAAPGGGDSAATIRCIPEAALNVVVYAEYGGEIGEYLRTGFGIPSLCPGEGPPIGFDAAAGFVRQVCEALDTDPGKALDTIDKARGRAYLYLSRFSSLLGLPKGALFSLKAEASTAYTLTRWFCGYLGMIPAAVSVLPDSDPHFTQKLKDFLEVIHYGETLQKSIIEAPTHILLADGNTIAELKLYGQQFCGIEIYLPSLGYMDITEKSIFGGEGALFLLEQILNGLRYVIH
ncbi:oxidoreductase/nitrogenase, component 1 [Treponema primitia ZAS-2]|uniref:Oxidoreductase/nitrogenase, component 1 n=1 Tax=Treponema primitia (strain ATCC BAA-887 / DSM 12427 / ZAS-2) TaxID=545694 RepID=F5YLA1_TREPZ|nr:nitrogenase component 1 [Treponema primitia]AEF85679.1 oxidoreductase/nitrogenase, component 1 [Treponema primitia ZAS-2]